jgi:hypothetical protein
VKSNLIKEILSVHPQAVRCQAKHDFEGIDQWADYFKTFDVSQLQDIFSGLTAKKPEYTEKEIAELESDLDRF